MSETAKIDTSLVNEMFRLLIACKMVLDATSCRVEGLDELISKVEGKKAESISSPWITVKKSL